MVLHVGCAMTSCALSSRISEALELFMLMSRLLQASAKADLETALSYAQQGNNQSQRLQQDVQRLQNELQKLQVSCDTCVHCAVQAVV